MKDCVLGRNNEVEVFLNGERKAQIAISDRMNENEALMECKTVLEFQQGAGKQKFLMLWAGLSMKIGGHSRGPDQPDATANVLDEEQLVH